MIIKNKCLWQVEASTKGKQSYGANVNAWVIADDFEHAVNLFKHEHRKEQELHIIKCFKVKGQGFSRFALIYDAADQPKAGEE